MVEAGVIGAAADSEEAGAAAAVLEDLGGAPVGAAARPAVGKIQVLFFVRVRMHAGTGRKTN